MHNAQLPLTVIICKIPIVTKLSQPTNQTKHLNLKLETMSSSACDLPSSNLKSDCLFRCEIFLLFSVCFLAIVNQIFNPQHWSWTELINSLNGWKWKWQHETKIKLYYWNKTLFLDIASLACWQYSRLPLYVVLRVVLLCHCMGTLSLLQDCRKMEQGCTTHM